MKILIIGTPRQATLNIGSNGLGRHVYDYIGKFVEKGDEVTALLHPDSKLQWSSVRKLSYTDEARNVSTIKSFIKFNNFDVVMDNSHFHLLSKLYHDEKLPVMNFIHDEECDYMPSNCVVANSWQKTKYKTARVYRSGILAEKYPFVEEKEQYLSFCAKIEHRKGYDIAMKIAEKSNQKIVFAGPRVPWQPDAPDSLTNWIGEIKDHHKFCNFVGRSKCLVYPSRSEAGGLAILEAMAMGTPCLTIKGTGTSCNVEHNKTGFIADNAEHAAELVANIDSLDTNDIRKFFLENHDFNKNFEIIHQQMLEFIRGERW